MSEPPIIQLDSVSSTMDEMAALLAAGPVEPWTAVVAEFQSQGRGRADRVWTAPPGSALLATIYAPVSLDPSRLGLLAAAAGISVADAVAGHGANARLKWPNDVLLDDRKLAGILVSSRIGERIETAVGIGVNLASAPVGAISLSEVCPTTPQPLELLREVREEMRDLWGEIARGAFDHIRDRWNAAAAWKGQVVAVPGDDRLSGRLIGIDDRGRLWLASEAGEIALTQSEIVRGPVPVGPPSYTCS